MRTAPAGLTLIELLVVLAIISLVIVGSPSIGRMMEQNRSATNINALLGAIHFARNQALLQGRTVTLCPSENDRQCSGAWHGRLLIFIDADEDGTVDTGDRLLRTTPPLQGGTVTWNSFRRRPWLQMTREGMTNHQNGNFLYCSNGGDPRHARQIVINVPGRPRQSRDVDGDGIVEDRRGRDLDCSD